MRSIALAAMLLVPAAVYAPRLLALDAPGPGSSPTVDGTVADPSGAIVPGAEVDLVDDHGTTAVVGHTDAIGNFHLAAPHAGLYTVVVREPGFDTLRQTVQIAAHSPVLHLTLPIAAMATNVHVSADSDTDLTDTSTNPDASVMTSEDLKNLPIFDNDYATAMSAFLDDSAAGSGGSGLLVDGVEANRATVSASAVQEIRINQDPYSAQYYWPGRGQMEIITKSAAEHYHGQFNFLFRDSALNAQNALAPSKPFEQRRVYEGHTTGPIPHMTASSFLASFNRAEEDLDNVISATLAPSASNPSGAFTANISAPTRDTEFSLRAAHQYGQRHSAYAQYSYQDWNGKNQGPGGQTLAAAATNNEYREDDAVVHVDSTLSASLFNQISVVAERDWNRHQDTVEAPRVSVSGYFTGGSAQGDYYQTEYNIRFYEMATLTHGRHMIKTGFGTPHISRRAFDDQTNQLGSYTFGPTTDASGNVLVSAIANYTNNHPSAFSQNTGDTHFIYHQQEMGAFIQDQYKLTDRFTITPGIRYDWQNFLATRRAGFAPRVSFAWVLSDASKTVVRGGGGLYYDRFGSGPLLDLARYENARRRSIVLSLNPATSCMPISSCMAIASQPPALAQLAPHAAIPYQIQYGLSIERQIGERATAVISSYSGRGIHEFRSVDVNAPTADSGYTLRPDTNYGRIRQMQPNGFWQGYGLDFSFRGRVNRRFTGFGRYTWSHYGANTGGLGWFPQNQFAPNDEWARAGWDRRHRGGMYAMFNSESIWNISAGFWANAGTPWTVQTGTDPFGTGLFNARPVGTPRNSRTNPGYVNLDLRWGHDFALTHHAPAATPSDDSHHDDEATPHLGFSASAFNVLNHVNPGGIDNVITSSSFGQPTSVSSPRRIQLAMRFEF